MAKISRGFKMCAAPALGYLAIMKKPLAALLERFVGRLRFPYLFLLTSGLFVTDLIVPDVIPLVDELLLALGTITLGSLRKRVAGRREKNAQLPGSDDEQTAERE